MPENKLSVSDFQHICMLTSRASALLSFLNLLFELDSRSPTRSCGSGSKNLTKKNILCYDQFKL